MFIHLSEQTQTVEPWYHCDLSSTYRRPHLKLLRADPVLDLARLLVGRDPTQVDLIYLAVFYHTFNAYVRDCSIA